MTDYISREEAVEALGEMPLNWTDSPEELQEVADWEEHLHAIMAIPAADVRQVVLCRDCRNCQKTDDWEHWCLRWGSPARLVRPDDWCSYGTRIQEMEEHRT